MSKRIILYLLAGILSAELVMLWHAGKSNAIEYESWQAQMPRSVVRKPAPPELPARKVLPVPYVNEAPENIWTGPWKNACEEATIVMVEKYYQQAAVVSVSEAKAIMQILFEEQNSLWGTNANSDADRMTHLIEVHASFHAVVKDNPTVAEIKAEISSGRPVITLHRGFDLGNKNIPFLRTGSSYHTLVITGYDDTAGVFITNDPGDSKEGEGLPYLYEVLMNSLHDYDNTTGLADGPPRVIFTAPQDSPGRVN